MLACWLSTVDDWYKRYISSQWRGKNLKKKIENIFLRKKIFAWTYYLSELWTLFSLDNSIRFAILTFKYLNMLFNDSQYTSFNNVV